MISTRAKCACKSLSILNRGPGTAMQSTSSSAGLSISWISSSAASKRQISGGTFLSQVAAVHGIAACTSFHSCSTLAGPQMVSSSNISHLPAGFGTMNSRSRTPSLLATASVCADTCLRKHAAQPAGVHTAVFQTCRCHSLTSKNLVKQQPHLCSCCVRCTSHQHTAGRLGHCSSSRFIATPAAATGHGQLAAVSDQAAAADPTADAGSNELTRGSSHMVDSSADSAWRMKRSVEWTQGQKMQVLYEKAFEKWQEDPASLGVRFAPGLKEQRCTCPQCHNGSSGDNSFAVLVREDAVLWKCWRATCGFKGGVNLLGGAYADSDKALDAATKFCAALPQGATAEALGSANDIVVQLQEQADYRQTPGALEFHFKELTEDALRWFRQRGISKKTLQHNGIMMEDKYCTQFGKVVPHIAFPYKKNARIVNVKYRALGVKAFTQSKGGEQILYGYDEAKGAEQLVIVEGEMDKLAFEEALQLHSKPPEDRRVAVVSVPAGAPGPSSAHMEQKFKFVESCADLLSSVKKVVLAVDADGPGVLLADELSRRIGREKCWRVTWPTGPSDSLHPDAFAKAAELKTALAAGQLPPFDAHEWARKDANEVLQKDGSEVLKAYLDKAVPLPIAGLYVFDEFWQQVYDLYQQGPRGLSWGVSTGWQSVDACYQVVPGELTIVTGLPNSGKSEWLDALAVNLARQHGWRFALCSLENTPKDHARKLMEKYTGKAFHQASYSVGTARMDMMEFIDALCWIDSHFHIIRPPPDTMPSIDYILEKARAAVLRYGIQGLIIDPYNELDPRQRGGTTETEHVSRLLTKIKRFAQHFDCHVWFVAHPRTQRGFGIGGGTATLPAPSMYEISGSANFINKADNGIVVHRPHSAAEAGQVDPLAVQLLIRKVRNKLAGKIGDVQLSYDRATGRYLDCLRQEM